MIPAITAVEVASSRSPSPSRPTVWSAFTTKPLSNHNYLKRVIEGMVGGVAPVAATATQQVQQATRMTSKTAGGMMALEALKGGH